MRLLTALVQAGLIGAVVYVALRIIIELPTPRRWKARS